MIELVYPLSAGALIIVLFAGVFSFLQDYRKRKAQLLEALEQQLVSYEEIGIQEDEELFSLLEDLQEVLTKEEANLQEALQDTVERLQAVLQA